MCPGNNWKPEPGQHYRAEWLGDMVIARIYKFDRRTKAYVEISYNNPLPTLPAPLLDEAKKMYRNDQRDF